MTDVPVSITPVQINFHLLREERKRLHWSQEWVATHAGISRSYYGELENGKKHPRPQVAANLAIVLRMNYSQLVKD